VSLDLKNGVWWLNGSILDSQSAVLGFKSAASPQPAGTCQFLVGKSEHADMVGRGKKYKNI